MPTPQQLDAMRQLYETWSDASYAMLVRETGVPRRLIGAILAAQGWRPGSVPDGWQVPRRNWHFQQRLWQRYRVILDPGHVRLIIDRIKRRRAPLITSRHPGGFPVYAVTVPFYDKGPLFIAADRIKGDLITAMSPERFRYDAQMRRWVVLPRSAAPGL